MYGTTLTPPFTIMVKSSTWWCKHNLSFNSSSQIAQTDHYTFVFADTQCVFWTGTMRMWLVFSQRNTCFSSCASDPSQWMCFNGLNSHSWLCITIFSILQVSIIYTTRSIPYGAKFSLVFNFTNFTNFQPFTKVFQWKILTHGVQCVCATNSYNYFNKIFKNHYLRKFRPKV